MSWLRDKLLRCNRICWIWSSVISQNGMLGASIDHLVASKFILSRSVWLDVRRKSLYLMTSVWKLWSQPARVDKKRVPRNPGKCFVAVLYSRQTVSQTVQLVVGLTREDWYGFVPIVFVKCGVSMTTYFTSITNSTAHESISKYICSVVETLQAKLIGLIFKSKGVLSNFLNWNSTTKWSIRRRSVFDKKSNSKRRSARRDKNNFDTA